MCLLPPLYSLPHTVHAVHAALQFHCHVNLHLDRGMMVTYTVLPSPTGVPPIPPDSAHVAPAPGGVERIYYVAADEVLWCVARAPCGSRASGQAPRHP